MTNPFRRLDQFIIRVLQDTYLWLLDWTGVYAATVGTLFILMGVASITLHDGVSGMKLFLSFINIAILLPNYVLQDKQNIKLYNIGALFAQESEFRFYVILGFFWPLLLVQLIQGKWWDAIDTWGIAMFIYMTCVMIREREPKEWFKKTDLAHDAI